MLVYEAEVDIAGAGGIKRVPLKNLYNNDGLDHLTLKPGELVTAVHLPQSWRAISPLTRRPVSVAP